MRAFQAILFDFDYTLADSSEAIVDCFNTGLRAIGRPPACADAIRRTIGLPLPDSLAQVAGEDARKDHDEFRRRWRVRSDAIMVAWTRLFEGTRPTILALNGEGYRLGVVSTKWRLRIDGVLEREGLRSRFGAVVGGDDVERLKPHPEGIWQAMRTLGAGKERTLYVGDSVTDAEAAAAAGVAFAAVASGVTPRAELASRSAFEVLEHVGQLPGLLARLTPAQTPSAVD